ncbi:MAG: NDP-sugar synthase [Desulfarculus sp.]|nr:NDP-sugar synthase [Desulfarculus sp.]
MHAMVLAAGLGTRLAPLTGRRPKCLMPVMNRPLLGWWLDRLAAHGVTRTVVNTHHLAPLVRAWLAEYDSAGLEVWESHEPVILGTGGGLVAAREALGSEPFLLVNSDVLAADDPRPLLARRAEEDAIAVLGLVDDPRFNTVALDQAGQVLGFKGQDLPAEPAQWRTYTGLAALHPDLLDYLPAVGFSTLVEGLSAALAAGRSVRGLVLPGFWDDLGTPERLLALHRRLLEDQPPGLADLAPAGPLVRGEGSWVDPAARIEGFCVLGHGARLEAGAYVRDSLLLPGAVVAAGARVSDAVLGDGFLARGEIAGGAHA